MGLFSKKTKEEVKPVKSVAKTPTKKVEKKDKVAKPATTKAVKTAGLVSRHVVPKNSVIIRPHITEKAGTMVEKLNTYVFEVHKDSNKKSIASAILAIYKVNPIKVRIIINKPKNVFVKGKHGTHAALKKAMVTLKKGDKLEVA